LGEFHVTLRVPASVRTMEANIGRGPCRAQGLNIHDMDLNVGLGPLTLSDCGGTWDVNVGKGDAVIQSSRGTFDINVGMGQCRLKGVFGTVDVNAGLGQVVGEECDGTFDVNAGKGNVEWTASRGRVEINAGLGDVRVLNGAGRNLEVNAGLGKVFVTDGHWEDADISIGIGDATIHAGVQNLAVSVKTRGTIDVSIPDTQGARVEASTGHGRIISHLDLIPVGHSGPQRGERLVGMVGDGAGRLTLETRRGDIIVAQHIDGQPETPSDAHPGSFREAHRLLILEQLQQGRLTVDEAEALLSGLDASQD
ncbi:MAG: DUF4097 domain-containing protein, partial [Firmicutes bacterium]|nr:DUF4097 domain-containing protein [Bacillota bacterium]